MDTATILTDILVVLVAAKVAAELAERLSVPAVVGEIVAGLVVGPSLLGLVGGSDEVLHTLGEIGVILLLLEVGMEMDLGELGRVGRSSILVAIVGVVAPMALGVGAMRLIGSDGNTALFVGAALTATSVGITARVFGDLRALASTEARTVLGAAVADDVMGLVVLTVVVRLVTEGSVSGLSVAGIVAVAVGFLVIGGVVGLRFAGPLFQLIERISRSPGTMVALALAFTLAFALLADAARLAPIIGAFLAGIALNRADQAPVIRRELAPVGHLFIPVFFLGIGIDAEISAFGRAEVLRTGAILLVCAVVGKLVSPLGAIGSPGDKLLIGLGMMPRGEVGLIFATIGLQTGVIGGDLYAALLLVVLVTTLAAPQLLKVRYTALRSKALAGDDIHVEEAEPPGGWLVIDGNEVTLAARPPRAAAMAVALDAAVRVGRNRPSPDLLDWLSGSADPPIDWSPATVGAFLDVVERGNARSWRFLDVIGLLGRAIPQLAEGIRAREGYGMTVDPLESHRFPALERFRGLDAGDPVAVEADHIQHRDRLLLALLLTDGLEAHRDPVGAARQVAADLGFNAGAQADVGAVVGDRELLWAAAHRTGGLGEAAVVPLATHMSTPERARTLYVVTALRNDSAERWELARLRELHGLIQTVLAGTDASDLVAQHRQAALDLADAVGAVEGVAERIASAPRSYVLQQEPAAIVRHAELLGTVPRARSVQVTVTDGVDCRWVDVVTRDRHGLLAAIAGVLAAQGLEVTHATVATWPDGLALDSFCVQSAELPSAAELERAIDAGLDEDLASPAMSEVDLRFDGHASPWHTTCDIDAPDQPRLLHHLTTAFAAAGINVVAATITSRDGWAYDSFLLDGPVGSKLGPGDIASVVGFVEGGVVTQRRRFRKPSYVTAGARQGADRADVGDLTPT